jgi:hypothetical protein
LATSWSNRGKPSKCVCVCVNSFGLFACWKIYKPLAKLATEAPSFITENERNHVRFIYWYWYNNNNNNNNNMYVHSWILFTHSYFFIFYLNNWILFFFNFIISYNFCYILWINIFFLVVYSWEFKVLIKFQNWIIDLIE